MRADKNKRTPAEQIKKAQEQVNAIWEEIGEEGEECHADFYVLMNHIEAALLIINNMKLKRFDANQQVSMFHTKQVLEEFKNNLINDRVCPHMVKHQQKH